MVDLKRVLTGGPWTYDNHLLILHWIQPGEGPNQIPLNSIDVWVQVFDLPFGYMSKSVGKQLGDYIGSFLEYDSNNSCEYHGFWAQDPLLNRPSICTGPLPDSNPNTAQNSTLHQNHTRTNQTGKTYISFKVPSSLIGRPTTCRIFIHGSHNIPI